MMRVTPFHHENYSRLILGVVMQFYQRCSDRFQSLTTRQDATTLPGVVADPEKFKVPAAWAQRAEIMKCLLQLLNTEVGDVTCGVSRFTFDVQCVELLSCNSSK